MRFDLIGFAEHDINPATVCSPAGYSRCVMLICVGDAPVMLFFEGIVSGAGIRISSFPELLYKVLSRSSSFERPLNVAFSSGAIM